MASPSPSPGPARKPGPNELRDHLANERTFLAWIRTTITIVALGFVVAKFGILLREVSGGHVHPLTARAGAVIGVLLVAGGVGVGALATMRFLRTRTNIEREVVDFSPTLDIVLGAVIIAIGILLAGYILVTS